MTVWTGDDILRPIGLNKKWREEKTPARTLRKIGTYLELEIYDSLLRVILYYFWPATKGYHSIISEDKIYLHDLLKLFVSSFLPIFSPLPLFLFSPFLSPLILPHFALYIWHSPWLASFALIWKFNVKFNSLEKWVFYWWDGCSSLWYHAL